MTESPIQSWTVRLVELRDEVREQGTHIEWLTWLEIGRRMLEREIAATVVIEAERLLERDRACPRLGADRGPAR